MTITARKFRSRFSWRTIGVLGVSVLAGCTTAGLGPDELELANMLGYHRVPHSSPAAFVRAFDTFCVNRPATMQGADALLRGANYVPTRKHARGRPLLYLVDDKRPAVAISKNMCLVQARSRTGQTEKVRSYTAKTFPTAVPAPARQFGPRIEQAWIIPGKPPTIIATERSLEPGNHSRYALIYYQPPGTTKH